MWQQEFIWFFTIFPAGSPKFGGKSQIALSSVYAATRSRTSSCYDLFNKDIT